MNVALIFAGGVGSRMGTKIAPKQFLNIDGRTILAHTIKNFEENHFIDAIIVVLLEKYIKMSEMIFQNENFTKIKAIVPGGKTGQESIYRGLLKIEELYPGDSTIVLIHDGVRPVIESDLIERNIRSVKAYRSAISAVPAKETIVEAPDTKNITGIIDRNKVWIARAPQSFYLNDVLNAHQKANAAQDESVIDSCSMMQKYAPKQQLKIVETIYDNIKVTTPMDYYLVKSIIEAQKNHYSIDGFINPLFKESSTSNE